MGAIEFVGVGKRYGSVRAVDDLSVSVAEGEFVTILGPSGSGKTTILSLVAGLVAPTAGRIMIAGRDVTDLSPQERKIGLVFQSYALFPHLTVNDNVAFPLAVRGRPKGEIAAKVDAALARVRLAGFGGRKPSQLSGGQQQRVALARAFVFEPDILLLDEPLGALDRKLREEVQVELKALQRDLGITTLLVTHDQEEALSLSDRLIVLDHGRMQQVGTPDDVYRRPANGFVAGFLGMANLLEGTVEANALRLPSGEQVACDLRGRPAGTKAAAIVRPERIRLAPPDAGGGMPATVTQTIYFGHLQRWHLTTDSGVALVAAAADGIGGAALGERVRATWSPEDVWLLPDADGGMPAAARPVRAAAAPVA